MRISDADLKQIRITSDDSKWDKAVLDLIELRELVREIHLLGIDDLSADDIGELLDLTDHMVEVNRRPNPKVPALRGKTVVSLFFEDSTRTRTSFDTAAKRLSADTMGFAVSSSSVNKGESLRDTVETITAMGVDAFVVRHRSSGAPLAITRWTDAAIVNAGDGWHQHPTQALLDCYTIRTRLGRTNDFSGLRIAIVGDVKHSRVARSDVQAFTALGAEVTLVAPRTLLPPSLEGWPVAVSHDLDSVLPDLDVLYLLRVQAESRVQRVNLHLALGGDFAADAPAPAALRSRTP